MSAPKEVHALYTVMTVSRPMTRITAAIRALHVGQSLFIPGKTSSQIGGRLRPIGTYSSRKAQEGDKTGVVVTRLVGPSAPERLRAKAPSLLAAVLKAAAQFEFYAEAHAAKGTPEADKKAEVNRVLAAEMRAVAAEAVGAVSA